MGVGNCSDSIVVNKLKKAPVENCLSLMTNDLIGWSAAAVSPGDTFVPNRAVNNQSIATMLSTGPAVQLIMHTLV